MVQAVMNMMQWKTVEFSDLIVGYGQKLDAGYAWAQFIR